MNDAVVTVLQKAKERIAEGWCQHTAYRLNQVCAWAALGVPYSLGLDQGAEFVAAVNILAAARDCPDCRSIPYHNDKCITSQVEALDWFERAIRLAKEHPEDQPLPEHQMYLPYKVAIKFL